MRNKLNYSFIHFGFPQPKTSNQVNIIIDK